MIFQCVMCTRIQLHLHKGPTGLVFMWPITLTHGMRHMQQDDLNFVTCCDCHNCYDCGVFIENYNGVLFSQSIKFTCTV